MILEATNVCKNFPQPDAPIQVLRGVNFSASTGEKIAILGQSGSGKSTLLSLLAGLDSPSSGEVKLAGHSLGRLGEEELAKIRSRHLGIIFQQFHLMSNLTALENVSLPLEIIRSLDATERATEALNLVGLGHRLRHFPAKLSGGECQRVAVARAFVMEPEVLLADEPSGNLDTLTGEAVMKLIFALSQTKKTTLILVTHNFDLAKQCDRIFELKNGVLTEQHQSDPSL